MLLALSSDRAAPDTPVSVPMRCQEHDDRERRPVPSTNPTIEERIRQALNRPLTDAHSAHYRPACTTALTRGTSLPTNHE